MKSTPKLIAGAVAIVMSFQTGVATAAPLRGATGPLLIAAAIGQAGANALDRQQVDALLVETRKAMKEGAYDRAESLLRQAEKANVRYGLFNFGDNPQRVRHDLDKILAKRDPRNPTGRRFIPSPTSPAENSATAGLPATDDPFLRRRPVNLTDLPPAQYSVSDRSPIPLPSDSQLGSPAANVDIPFPANALSSRRRMNSPSSGVAWIDQAGPGGQQVRGQPKSNGRSASDSELLSARRALAVGDLRRARGHLDVARSYQVLYQFNEDSPANVEAAIRRYDQVVQQRADREPTDAWRRQYALLLAEQAEALLKWKEYAEAERLANDASRLGISFGPYQADPQDLLRRIATARRSAAGLADGSSRLASSSTTLADKQKTLALLGKARQAIEYGDLAQADQWASQAMAIGVPDSAFSEGEDRPWLLALEVEKARIRNSGVMAAVASDKDASGFASRSVYNSAVDTTYNAPAAYDASPFDGNSATQTTAAPLPARADRRSIDRTTSQFAQSSAPSYRQPDQAPRTLRQAYQFNPAGRPLAEDRRQISPGPLASPLDRQPPDSLIDSTARGQQILARQLSAEVARQQAAARTLRDTDPKQALQSLLGVRQTVSTSGLDPAARAQLLRRVDRSIQDTEKYIAENRGQIELDERNREVLDEIDRRRQTKIVIEQELADLVDQFNTLRDEQRFAEMEVVAKRARNLAPEDPVVQQLWLEARFIRRTIMNRQLADDKEESVFATLFQVEKSSTPFADINPIEYGDVKEWEALSNRRRSRSRQERRRGMNERELEIQRKLGTSVMLEYTEQPLSEVMDRLADLADINIHLDPLGLADAGQTSDIPVTITLKREISLKSALHLILQPLNLSYVVKDEVLKITSEQLRHGEVYTDTYLVADLVIPIRNFMPGSQFGMQSALNYAHMGALAARGGMNANMNANNLGTPAATALAQGAAGNALNPQVLAQVPPGLGGQIGLVGRGGPPVSGTHQPIGMGPGGLGGAAQADFDSLIELITATIQPDSWDEVGGPGSVQPFETNLSLVISQTEEGHEQIVDLLEQLRRMQDLQVTIEVRFIRLSDSFFERIGIDFDFRIEDGDFRTAADFDTIDRPRPSTIIGLDEAGFTADLDIPFVQDSFSSATPAFGGFDVLSGTAANFGFAILSDIEAFFLIQAAQGDSRSNILEAPKVTLFNGQNATISDQTQRPFVTSVIPVVGDFAAAQQPVIVVLSEGTNLSLQAVVSPDRRYVRMTVVPFFSQIGDVQEFTFEGDSTTTTNSSATDADDDGNNEAMDDESTVRRQGTTVQLPEFSFVSVSTTVSVPDGGTVLLGGIKRLREGRRELGVPMLNKIPYLNRLFSNVGIGRDTESLMLMVTPRIIIQEEQEELLGIVQP